MRSTNVIKRKPVPTTPKDPVHLSVSDQSPAPNDPVCEIRDHRSPAQDKTEDGGAIDLPRSQLSVWQNITLVAIMFSCTLVIWGTIAYRLSDISMVWWTIEDTLEIDRGGKLGSHFCSNLWDYHQVDDRLSDGSVHIHICLENIWSWQ